MLTPTADIAAFLADPTGKVVLGETWLYFCANPQLYGIVMWGRSTGDDVAALVRVLRVELGGGIVSHGSFVDASRIESVDGEAFEELSRYVQTEAEPLSRVVDRLALVRPKGFAGAAISGFFEVSGLPYEVEVFDTGATALAWLREEPELLDEVNALVADVRGTSPLVARLRAWLREHLKDAALPDAARSLAMSERTLQRRLSEAETTFAAELLGTRLRASQQRMLTTDAPLSTIAFETGFSSQQHLSGAFRRAFGTTPSAWRKAKREV